MAVATASRGLASGNPGYDNLDPVLRSIADRIIAESGGQVWIGSGWRSIQRQSEMYNAWRNGTYNVPRVAAPGRSQHNHGRAIDFGGNLRLAQQLGRKYGLIFPMGDEPWHGQLGDNVRYSGEPDWQGMGIQYDLNYTGGQAQRPEDIFANRMASVASVLGGNRFGSGAMDTMSNDPLGIGEAAYESMRPGNKKSGQMAGKFATKGTGRAGDKFWEDPGKRGQFVNELAYGRPDVQNQYMVGRVSGDRNNPQISFVPGGDRNQLGQYARSLFQQFGFSEEDYPALVWLWNKESGDPRAGSRQVTWNPLADNPSSSAFGIAQFLDSTWKGTGIAKTTNPFQQIMAGLMYIKSRYRNPRNALQFHLRHNWY